MEFVTGFTKTQIAVLVLGYLKSEKCYKAFDEFLEESPYFQKNKQNIKMGKYFVTRVAGMCLVDLLEEYSSIYSIVQGRLEASNYYNEVRTKASLVEQILYLLDREVTVTNSTPFSVRSEVDTTPVHALPGHNGFQESEDSASKTPKRKASRSRSNNTKNLDKDEAFDVSEVLTQTLLENHELHEKIAETINIVRNTPEVSKTVSEEHISAGASKELDAIIKTVVQRTEEDPLYNKLIDEIIGTAPFDNAPIKKSSTPSCNLLPQNTPPCNVEEVKSKRSSEKKEEVSNSNNIDAYNNDAVRSIIEASQNVEPQAPQTNENKNENGEVYVFDGTLDNYLKSSGGTNQVAPNPVYINTGGLIVMPPETSKQFYIVNNQPLINMSVSTVKGMIMDSDIMSMPTIIVNDESQSTFTNQTLSVTNTTNKNPPNKRTKPPKLVPKPTKIEPALNEFLTINSSEASLKEKKKSKTTKGDLINSIPTMASEPNTVTASQTVPSVISTAKTPTSRQASHVRNLDFSTPHRGGTDTNPLLEKVWDADLRSLVNKNDEKSPTPKRKRPVTNKSKKKTKAKNKFEEKVQENKEEDKNDKSEESKEDVKIEAEIKEEAKENNILTTPIKNTIPKTPGTEDPSNTNSLHYTPFNDVLEEQLRGVDLISLPTPKMPITPGFAITPGLSLTPAEMIPYNNRSTDYSTSSSYYQPSDTEQNKSLDQLIEECKNLEKKSPPQSDKFRNLKILSDVVIEQAKIPTVQTKKDDKKKNCQDHLKKFNHNVIGKKNLHLLKPSTSSSSSDSDSSDTESEESGDHSNNTIICKNGGNAAKKTDPVSISSIISNVEVKSILDEEIRKKTLLSHLEEVRKRTISIIKNPTEAAKRQARNKKQAPNKTPRAPKVAEAKKKKNAKKKESPNEENTDEEAQKLVTGLAQRGIHLIPKKSPKSKNAEIEEVEKASAKPQEPEKTLSKPEEGEKTLPKPEELEKALSKPEQVEKCPSKFKETPLEVKEAGVDDVIFDTKCYEDCEVVIHEEKRSKGKTTKIYDFEVLKKGFEAKLFIEEIQEEMTRVMRSTNFEILADFSPKINILTPRKAKKSEEDIQNDLLMDYVVIGGSPDVKQTPKGGKKRKSRSSEDDNRQTDKKSKTYEHNIKLLKKIDVDSFLDKVHGE